MNENIISYLKEIIITAGEISTLRQGTGLIIEDKEDNSPVTNVDKEISDFIYQRLQILTPDIPVVCEERPKINLNSNSFWLIDPIDGTGSYIKGDNTYTINIGLIEELEPKIGLIYQPSADKLYYTDHEGRLKIEQHGKIYHPKTKLVQDRYTAAVSSRYLNAATRNFLEHNIVNEIINIPSSIKLCLIAEGIADIYPRFGPTMEWDIAAGHALIKASNGNVLDLQGKQITYRKEHFANPHFLACNKRWLDLKLNRF